MPDSAAQQLPLGQLHESHHTQLSAYDVGTYMSAFEVVVALLLVIWTPGLAFMAYLVMPRPGDY
jgi:hypothetical protein